MHSCRVPSDVRGTLRLEVTFDTGPLAGKITGKCPVEVAD